MALAEFVRQTGYKWRPYTTLDICKHHHRLPFSQPINLSQSSLVHFHYIMAESLVFAYGSTEPVKDIRLHSAPAPADCGPHEAVVDFLAAPINPLDFLVLHGKYPVKPQNHIAVADGEHRPIPGSDGAARIIKTGSAVTQFHVGDTVILRTHCRGSWRTHAVLDENDVLRVPSELDPRLACILRMGVAPAHFLLRDYSTLEPGDWIIQNAATGTVSHFVTQLARLQGVNVISVIRDRGTDDELERTKRSLRSHGASIVLTVDELKTVGAEVLAGKRVNLAIDFVSNDALARLMASFLAPGATLVTAGFLGVAPSGPEGNLRQFLWQRNITLKAFRLSDCLGRRSAFHQMALLEWFARLFMEGTLRAPALEYVRWKRGDQGLEGKLQEVLERHERGEVGERKKILVFEH
ncbi:MDR family NADPH-dependent oxidoreductase [Aspergillus fischeri NRRL 181]|uniref:enoyl-[acyl-carrier-protein] reductase n=1 Tax=Neosartorya fischeri (strain ATCC 1020 / DSM 3700 / CBS 544.65 / FGSC A1164 / JCM 1740 / NRRL 181 / WB 181) TaxID=331117 RepID=A1DKF0_NEOFI|nr:mitochondrial enoyl reductase, putative [Aspergillus fischeri NRRL 181]EAW17189.1 mitochondrial enoyl reductase, putative [Aspergillus fischeri NRRL 181]